MVELLSDHGPSRRFGNVGMELFDLRQYDTDEVLQQVLDKGTTRYQLTYNDRALQFFRTFVEATEKPTTLSCLRLTHGSLSPKIRRYPPSRQ